MKEYSNFLFNSSQVGTPFKVFHSSVRKTKMSNRLLQKWLVLWVFSKNGILMHRKRIKIPNTGRVFWKLCFLSNEQYSKIKNALGLTRRSITRTIAELKKHDQIIQSADRQSLIVKNPFGGKHDQKYTLTPIRVKNQSILKKGFPLMEYIMQCIKTDALSPRHSQCRLHFGQKRRTFFRRKAVLTGFWGSAKNVHSVKSQKLLIVKTTARVQNFLKKYNFKTKRNSLGEKFYLLPRLLAKRRSRFYFIKGRKFELASKFDLESLIQAKQKNIFGGLWYLKMCEQTPKFTKYKRPPGEVEGQQFKAWEMAKTKKVRHGRLVGVGEIGGSLL